MKLKKARRSNIYFTSGRILHIDNIEYVSQHDNMIELMTIDDLSFVVNLNNVEYYSTWYEERKSEDDKTE